MGNCESKSSARPEGSAKKTPTAPPIPRLPTKGPVAERRPHAVLFGRVPGEDRGEDLIDPPIQRSDDLFWLRDDTRSKPDVLAHLSAEAEFCKQQTAQLNPLIEKIYEEHISHIKETDSTAPYPYGPYEYFTRTEKGLAYSIYCRNRKGQPEEVETYLDVNKLAEGHSQCVVDQVEPGPPDHTLIAYSVDYVGDELYEIHFLGSDDVLKGTSGEIVWGNDATTLFYVTKNEEKRSNKVWRHVLGQPQSADTLLKEESDTLFDIGIDGTREGKHLIISCTSSETSERWLLDLTKADAVATVVRAREKGIRYSVEVMASAGKLFIFTNSEKRINGCILEVPMAQSSDWSKVVIPHSDRRMIDRIECFANFAVVEGREDGLTQLWVLTLDGDLKRIPFDEELFCVEISKANYEYDSNVVRIVYSSIVTPTTWIHLNPLTLERIVLKQQEVPSGYRKEDYVVERRFASGVDGVQIPISLARKVTVDLTKNTPLPTYLYGYGSYGICIDPEWKLDRIPLLERGIVVCIAHIRGGAELGRAWYETQGKYLTKRTTFLDFISCAEYLFSSKITSRQLLAIEGRSAGGLLMGAVLNMRPDICKVAVAGVPFVDVMNSMCDPSIPLTTGEWEEWGNPNSFKFHDYMLSYSPYDNVRAQPYPNILITAGLHDPRVAYWEAAKWATRLRLLKTNDTEVVLKCDLEAGHFSASDRYKYYKERAFDQAYIVSKILS